MRELEGKREKGEGKELERERERGRERERERERVAKPLNSHACSLFRVGSAYTFSCWSIVPIN